ncbi:MAG: hypothetical protein Q4C45_01920 [Oscillospiraceae bacterium]|nr:hypothetical protein [Oscillospiraceae bacterium]
MFGFYYMRDGAWLQERLIAMAFFIWYMIKTNREDTKANMAQVQERCQQREEKLYEQIGKVQATNEIAIHTIARYSEKLDSIQWDVKEIKEDVIALTAKAD